MEEYNVTFVHPTTGATLTAQINPNLTVGEVINALVTEAFIDAPNLLSSYYLCINDNTISEKETLSSAGITDGSVIPVVEAYYFEGGFDFTFIHPNNNDTIALSVNPFFTVKDIIDILASIHFIEYPSIYHNYVLRTNNGVILKRDQSLSTSQLQPGQSIKIVEHILCNVTFIHPNDDSSIQLLVNRDVTSDEITSILVERNFIDKPCIYTDYYYLIEDLSSVGENHLLGSTKLTNECSVRVMLNTYNITILHPTEKTTINVQINPNLESIEIINLLVTLKFIVPEDFYHNYVLTKNDGCKLERNQKLSSSGVKNGDSINVVIELFTAIFIHPTNGSTLKLKVNPYLAIFKIINTLLDMKFIDYRPGLVEIKNGGRLGHYDSLITGGFKEGDSIYLFDEQEFDKIKSEQLEYEVTFIHPYNGSTLTCHINPRLTANEAIDALSKENFIDDPSTGIEYRLEIIDGITIEKEQTFFFGGLKDGNTINILKESIC